MFVRHRTANRTGPGGHLVGMAFRDEGFFHALQQEPENDDLRLVYADFLEDRGDDESLARGEFIRVQVEWAALPPTAKGAAERAAQLTTRQNELLTQWQRVWLGDWAEVLASWTFRRGFVEAVQADASVFLDCAADWFAEWPPLNVAKLTRAGHLLPELAASPWLAHLRGLDLSNNGIDSAGLAHLTASRFLCLLQALDLSDNPIGPAGAGLLATAWSADELSELHLARCGLWHEGLLALIGSRSGHPLRLRRLDLSDNGLYRLALVRLVDSPGMRRLESLDLSGNPLGNNGASVLADSSNASELVDLGLSGTGAGDREVIALATSRHLRKLRSLDLRFHSCGRQLDRAGVDRGGIGELARSPLLGQLRRLLLGRLGPTRPSNGWTYQVLSILQPPRARQVVRDYWMVNVLRQSPYLFPSQLVECDLEELWWLGDTRNRERTPSLPPWAVFTLEQYPELLDRLSKAQAAVLRLRCSLEEEPRTLKEIAERLGLTREQVKQVEFEALRKLRELWDSMPRE